MKTKQQGFTLMELMIVMVIIGILAAAFAGVGGSMFSKSKERAAKARMQSLAIMLQSYRTVEGEYPDDRLPKGTTSNRFNSHSEALFLALFDPEYSGERPAQDWLVNTDGDETTRNLTILQSRELFEIGDEWGNPIVYFESLHYSNKAGATVQAGEDEYYEEQNVSPGRSERTGSFYEPSGFQLVSAGADGLFETEDDLFSYTGDQ